MADRDGHWLLMAFRTIKPDQKHIILVSNCKYHLSSTLRDLWYAYDIPVPHLNKSSELSNSLGGMPVGWPWSSLNWSRFARNSRHAIPNTEHNSVEPLHQWNIRASVVDWKLSFIKNYCDISLPESVRDVCHDNASAQHTRDRCWGHRDLKGRAQSSMQLTTRTIRYQFCTNASNQWVL